MACKNDRPRDDFDVHVFGHARDHKRKLVCKACQEKGYTIQNCETYFCRNGCARGSACFDGKSLENFKARNSSLLCQDFRTKDMQDEAKNQARETKLLKILRAKDSWKCTCDKKLRPGSRARAALEGVHTEKCMLAPSTFGDRRWDGKNNGVTKEDLRFLNARKNNKWS